MFLEETLGKRINRQRAREIADSGAAGVATACLFCTTMISDGIKDLKADVAVMDLAEISDRMAI